MTALFGPAQMYHGAAGSLENDEGLTVNLHKTFRWLVENRQCFADLLFNFSLAGLEKMN